jgi:hypothetical protein
MSEPKFGRREALARMGAAALVPLVGRYHPLVPAQESPWTPRFLEDSEVDTVTALAERIIPRTDTPGAKDALVHQYVDWVLFQGEADRRERFRDGLRSLDQKCQVLFGKRFTELEEKNQDEFLGGISSSPFFQEAKSLTAEGYYRSEVGMKAELGFVGNTFLAEFEGCTHEEHRNWKPPA